MKKGNKIIRNVITVLVVIVLSLIAFIGIYVEKNGVYQNLIPSFTYGMDIDGTRELRYLLDTTSEEKPVLNYHMFHMDKMFLTIMNL